MKYDWDDIKTRYIAGDSAYQIERLPDTPSRQAICKRAKAEEWSSLRVDEKSLPDQAVFQGLDGVDDLDERKRAVLEGLRRWATYKDAAALAGVDESTVRRWRKVERFARLCWAALAVNKLEMTEVIR